MYSFDTSPIALKQLLHLYQHFHEQYYPPIWVVLSTYDRDLAAIAPAIIRPNTEANPELMDDINYTFLNIHNITKLNYSAYLRNLTFIFDELRIALDEVPLIEWAYMVALGGVPFLDEVKKTLLSHSGAGKYIKQILLVQLGLKNEHL